MSWINELKQGDKVIIKYRHGHSAVASVDRVTKTLIVVRNQKFRKETLKLQGSSYYGSPTLSQCTEKKKAEIKYREDKQELLLKIEGFDLNIFTLTKLKKINDLIEELRAEHEG